MKSRNQTGLENEVNRMKKFVSLFYGVLIVIGLLGCSNQAEEVEIQEEKINFDDVFIEEFSRAINERWGAQDKLDEYENEAVYFEKNIEILENELGIIKQSLTNVESKELKELGSQYIEGAEYQIEMFKTTDWDLQWDYNEKAEQLRKPALIKLVDEYNVIIEDEFQQIYKDFKEKSTVISKENDANNFAEKLIYEIVFEKTTGDYGDNIYTAIVENTSDFEFEYLSYDVQIKDSEGVVISNDFIYLENFTPGTKQKVELLYLPEDTESLELSLDHFAIK